MQPTTEFKTQLFEHFEERVEEHFYGHVVTAEAILPMVVSKGPRNSRFLFNYANRGNNEMVCLNFICFSFILSIIGIQFMRWLMHLFEAHDLIVFEDLKAYFLALLHPSLRYFLV